MNAQNKHRIDIFQPKQDSFQESCISHLWCLRKCLLSLILASFVESYDFITNFIAKEVTLTFTFSCPESTFSRNALNSVFSFRLYSSKGKRKIHWNFCIFGHFGRFLSNLNILQYIYMRYLRNRYHTALSSRKDYIL